MKKLLISLIACLVVASVNYAQSTSGEVVQETRTVKPFTEITVSDGIDIYVRQGNTTEVVAKADQSAIAQLITEVRGDALHIEVDRSLRNVRILDVYIIIPDLEFIEASGGSDVAGDGLLSVKNLKLMGSGG